MTGDQRWHEAGGSQLAAPMLRERHWLRELLNLCTYQDTSGVVPLRCPLASVAFADRRTQSSICDVACLMSAALPVSAACRRHRMAPSHCALCCLFGRFKMNVRASASVTSFWPPLISMTWVSGTDQPLLFLFGQVRGPYAEHDA